MNNEIKILAVDDENFNLVLLQSCLKGDKYTLTTCNNAVMALDEFKRDDFDVILLDILMVGIDGFGVRKLIREHNTRIPIIFLTSMVDDINSTLLSRIADDQYSYYMNKFFNAKHLKEKIDQAVEVYHEHRNADSYYHKLEENLAIAEDVQKIMLPNWCSCSASSILAYLYVPGMEVSGDMLEVLQLDDHRTLFFIGDIAGHGIQAALYMSAVQAFLKVLLLDPRRNDFTPHALLNQIERFFKIDLGGKTYMTCLVAIFDFEKNHLAFQSAGHPGLICCSPKEGRAWTIDSGDRGGVPIGLTRQNKYVVEDTVDYDFEDDSVFMAYTDGILDLNNSSGESLDLDTIHALLGHLARESEAVVIPFRLRSALSQMGYDVVSDDISIAVLQKRRHLPMEHEQVVVAETTEVNSGVAEIGNFVMERTGSLEASTKVELLLREFLNNVIIHGMESRKYTQSDMFVRLIITDDLIRVRVVDRGKEWNYKPNFNSTGDFLEQKNQDKAVSGRGMAIIYSITEAITRCHYFGLNETVFSISRAETDFDAEAK